MFGKLHVVLFTNLAQSISNNFLVVATESQVKKLIFVLLNTDNLTWVKSPDFQLPGVRKGQNEVSSFLGRICFYQVKQGAVRVIFLKNQIKLHLNYPLILVIHLLSYHLVLVALKHYLHLSYFLKLFTCVFVVQLLPLEHEFRVEKDLSCLVSLVSPLHRKIYVTQQKLNEHVLNEKKNEIKF